jgi:hypothetical protein
MTDADIARDNISREAYAAVAARRTQFDQLVWQVPVLSLTAQAFLFSIALSPDGTRTTRIIASLLSLVMTLSLLLLEGGLAVLTDHHEGRQEDCLKRDDQCQRRPGAPLEYQHPEGEHGDVHVDEKHGSCVLRDGVRNPQLCLFSMLRQVSTTAG